MLYSRAQSNAEWFAGPTRFMEKKKTVSHLITMNVFFSLFLRACYSEQKCSEHVRRITTQKARTTSTNRLQEGDREVLNFRHDSNCLPEFSSVEHNEDRTAESACR